MNPIVGVADKCQILLNQDQQILYRLSLGHETVLLNDLLGKTIRLEFNGVIHCIACGRQIKKSFQQGYCFPCTQKLAQCDICILKPELCHYEQGTCREPDWADNHCMKDHYVYLANASGLKVGITRGSNIPTRWLDQGAAQALPIIQVKNRRLSGLVEVMFKEHVADKTNWRKMLQADAMKINLQAKRDELFDLLANKLDQLISSQDQDAVILLREEPLFEFNYPIEAYPPKINGANFDSSPVIEGKLMGMKGQYLLFEHCVLNMRNFIGYQLTLSCRD